MMKKFILLMSFGLCLAQLEAQHINFFNIKTNIQTENSAFNAELRQIIGLPEKVELSSEPNQVFKDKLGMVHSKFNIKYQDIPVEFSTVITHRQNNEIISVNGEYFEGLDNISSAVPTLSNKGALTYALSYIKASKYVWQDNETNYDYLNETGKSHLKEEPNGELVFCGNYENKEDVTLHLAYKFKVWSVSPYQIYDIYVDANSGELLLKISIINNVDGTAATRYSGRQTIATDATGNQFRLRDYDNNRGDGIETFNGTVGTDFLDNDNNWTSAEYDNANFDNAALDAHWGAMMTYDYFNDIHGRDSYDDNGLSIRVVVHLVDGLGNPVDNAFWNPVTETINFGDGVSIFSPLTSLDVVAHEFGHGLDEFSSGLIYMNESGALDESFGDIWGACVEHFVNPNRDKWQIGEQIMINGQAALRSMSKPNQENQPNTYRGTNWYSGAADNGGVHTNSGVGNHWFYLLSEGGTGTNDNSDNFNVGAISIENAEQIAYRALTVYFTPNTDYEVARDLTIAAALDLFPACSQEVVSTTNAWYAVGVGGIFQQDDNLTITQTIASDINEVFIAEDNITASNIIEDNTIITYIAGSSINLTPGFKVNREANFNAYIETCNSLNFGKRGQSPDSYTTKPKKEDLDTRFNIYPNPTTNSISINLMETELNEPISVTIYNSLGSRVLYKTYIISSFDISLYHLPSGIYFVEIIENNIKYQSKIIKK